jgi:hypothetical protein
VENRARVAGKLTGALPDIDAGDATVFLLARGEFVPAGGEPKRVDTEADGLFRDPERAAGPVFPRGGSAA